MSYWPLPDPLRGDPRKCANTQGKKHKKAGERLCQCNAIEVCAVHIMGCLSTGCSGSRLSALSQFLGCFAGKEEGTCTPSLSTSCAVDSGLNQTQLKSCIADRKTVSEIYSTVWARGKNVPQFPSFYVNGKRWKKKDNQQGIKKALCEAGAKAAC